MNSIPTIITIAGNNSSGKSTIARSLADFLVYKHESTGDEMRSIAIKRQITLEKLSKEAETDPTIDEALDAFNKEIGARNRVVLDSRLGFYFIPNSFKVFLSASVDIAAKRYLEDKARNPQRLNETNNVLNSVEDVVCSLNKRLESERKRYRVMYNIEDHTDPNNFDLVIDTGSPEFDNNINGIVFFIQKKYNEWLISAEKKQLQEK